MTSEYEIRIKPCLGGEQCNIISPDVDPDAVWVMLQAVLYRLHGPIHPTGVMQDWLECQPGVVKVRDNVYAADKVRAALFKVWFG